MRIETAKHYLTGYEKELIENIDKLKSHIQELNKHLISANGYAPTDPWLNEYDTSYRTEFVMKVISKDEFLKLYNVKRAIPMKGMNYPHTLRLTKKKDSFDGFNDMFFSINDLRKLSIISGSVVDGRIINDKFIEISELPNIRLPHDFFKEIEPANKPTLYF